MWLNAVNVIRRGALAHGKGAGPSLTLVTDKMVWAIEDSIAWALIADTTPHIAHHEQNTCCICTRQHKWKYMNGSNVGQEHLTSDSAFSYFRSGHVQAKQYRGSSRSPSWTVSFFSRFQFFLDIPEV